MKESTKKEIYSWIKTIAFSIGIAIICKHFIFTPTTVFGESMSPTYEDDDRVMLSKTSEIAHFDVIVFDAPDVEGENYIKRVIGLPGDRIEMKEDVLYINREAFEEPYLTDNREKNLSRRLTENFTLQEKFGVPTVPEGMLFVMGDNRLVSKDSRIFGFIPYDSVIGEAKFRFYPIQEMGIPHK
jgi:signal peptidase I